MKEEKTKFDRTKGLIYWVTNKVNGKVYIGQTIQTLNDRKKGHLYSVYNSNTPDYNCIFHRAIRKYGEINFEWEILEDGINKEYLNQMEIYYISECNSYIKNIDSWGYNMTKGGNSHSGKDHPAYDNSLFSFEHYDGRTEIDVTKFYMKQKYSLESGIVSAITSSKAIYTNGWGLLGWNKTLCNTDKTYSFEHLDGSIEENVSQYYMCNKYNVSSSDISSVANGKSQYVKGWGLVGWFSINKPKLKNVLYSFIHNDGRKEINVTQHYMKKTYNLQHSKISCVVGGSRKSTGGWRLYNG